MIVNRAKWIGQSDCSVLQFTLEHKIDTILYARPEISIVRLGYELVSKNQNDIVSVGSVM